MPVVTSIDVTSVGAVQLRGRGFVEGNNSKYNFPGGMVTDADISGSPTNVSSSSSDNDTVNLPLPLHGLGALTVTTLGGTSARSGNELLASRRGHAR